MPATPAIARAPRRARLTLAEDIVHIGVPATVEFTLTSIDPQEAELDRTEPVSVLVIATPCSSVSLDSPVASYATDDDTPARFVFTASKPGKHRLRFRVCDPTSGTVLQVVEAKLPVEVSDPLKGP